MAVKADQELIKTVINDTISFLCRNGLTFKSRLCIEASIGVTLDDADVYLISINELIESEKHKERDAETERNIVPLHPVIETHKHKQWKRMRMKTESGNEAGVNEESDNGLSESATKPPDNLSVKHEVDEGEKHLVLIKEPQDSSWQQQQHQPQSVHMYSNISDSSNSGFDDQNFSSFSDMNLVPVVLQQEGAMRAQVTQVTRPMQQAASRSRGTKTSTVTSEGQGDDQTPGQSGQDTSQVGAIIK